MNGSPEKPSSPFTLRVAPPPNLKRSSFWHKELVSNSDP
jgi:hypothetical protein